jgi:hypothetical protein
MDFMKLFRTEPDYSVQPPPSRTSSPRHGAETNGEPVLAEPVGV